MRLICDILDGCFRSDKILTRRFSNAQPVGGKVFQSLICHVKDRTGLDRRYAIDASQIETEQGEKSWASFEIGIRKTIDWYLDNEAWWRSVMDGSYREWVTQSYNR